MIIPAAEVFCEPLLHQQDKARGELLTLGLGSQHDGGLSSLLLIIKLDLSGQNRL